MLIQDHLHQIDMAWMRFAIGSIQKTSFGQGMPHIIGTLPKEKSRIHKSYSQEVTWNGREWTLPRSHRWALIALLALPIVS